MICKVQGKRFVYKFVCDLKTLIGYSAAELSRLVSECEQKKMAKLQLHGIAQPVTALALASLQSEKDNWALGGSDPCLSRARRPFIFRLYSVRHDFLQRTLTNLELVTFRITSFFARALNLREHDIFYIFWIWTYQWFTLFSQVVAPLPTMNICHLS